jgi:hypothetical protein
MKAIPFTPFLPGIILLVLSCQPQQATLTESQKSEIANTAKAVVQNVIDNSNRLDFKAALQNYSGDPDTRYIENGMIFPSLTALEEAYNEFGPTLELLENRIDSWDIIVLAADAVSITLPIQLRIKPKNLSEYNGRYVWSGIVQKRNGKWMIVQSHESWLNYTEVVAALTPPSDNP